LAKLQRDLVKKNELINVTLDSQEKLAFSAAEQQSQLHESRTKLERSKAKVKEL